MEKYYGTASPYPVKSLNGKVVKCFVPITKTYQKADNKIITSDIEDKGTTRMLLNDEGATFPGCERKSEDRKKSNGSLSTEFLNGWIAVNGWLTPSMDSCVSPILFSLFLSDILKPKGNVQLAQFADDNLANFPLHVE